MTTNDFSLRLRYATGLCAWALAGSLHAQPTNPATKPGAGSSVAGTATTGVAVPPAAGGFRQSVKDAKVLARNNSLTAAEQALTRDNKFAPATAEWRMETTQKLTDLARELAREGNKGAVPGLAAQSLQHLDQVAALTQDTRTKAKAKAAAAVIQEQLVGDPTAAIAAYQAAVQLDPNDAGTKEALERLQKADANLRAKIQPKRK